MADRAKKEEEKHDPNDGMFPVTAPSELLEAPSDYAHIYHEPSKMENEAKRKPEAVADSVKKMIKDGDSEQRRKEVPKAKPVVTPVPAVPVKDKPPVPEKPVARPQAQQAKGTKFDLNNYLEALAAKRVVYTDPWTNEKVWLNK
ncbi:hypothetical protein HDE_10366 [Halotydeus destructor]|nr:hypothetical protein HDE_10366 [Halotydeus destructor]